MKQDTFRDWQHSGLKVMTVQNDSEFVVAELQTPSFPRPIRERHAAVIAKVPQLLTIAEAVHRFKPGEPGWEKIQSEARDILRMAGRASRLEQSDLEDEL